MERGLKEWLRISIGPLRKGSSGGTVESRRGFGPCLAISFFICEEHGACGSFAALGLAFGRGSRRNLAERPSRRQAFGTSLSLGSAIKISLMRYLKAGKGQGSRMAGLRRLPSGDCASLYFLFFLLHVFIVGNVVIACMYLLHVFVACAYCINCLFVPPKRHLLKAALHLYFLRAPFMTL